MTSERGLSIGSAPTADLDGENPPGDDLQVEVTATDRRVIDDQVRPRIASCHDEWHFERSRLRAPELVELES